MTDLGIATLSAEVAGGGSQALLANAARALTVADVAARADLALIVTALNNVLVELGQKLESGQAVSVSNLPATQPVSATALPLPAGAATQTTLAAVLDALAVSTAIKRQKTHVEFLPSSAAPTTIYKGYAPPGTADIVALWTIQRFIFTGTTAIDETWSSTTAVWADRATTVAYT